MIRDIKCKLIYLQKNKIEIAAVFLSLILFFEVYFSYYMKHFEMTDQSKEEESFDTENKVELKDIIKELTDMNMDILSVEKIDDSYNIELNIKGKKDELVNVFKSLNNYKIIDYEFSIDCNNVEGKVRLSYN